MYLYEKEITLNLIKGKLKKDLSYFFLDTHSDVDDVLWLDNLFFVKFLHPVYQNNLEIMDSIYTKSSASQFDIFDDF